MCNPATQAVQDWRSAAEALSGNLPGERAVDRVLRWISIESCGNECSIDGSKKWQDAAGWIQDAGVMQIYFETQGSVIHGATSASLRANCFGTTQMRTRTLSDDERRAVLAPQIAWLEGAIAHAQSQLDAVGATWPERDQWRWYKMSIHGLPTFAHCMLWMVVQKLGRAPADWDEFRSTADGFSLDEVRDAAGQPVANDCTSALAHHGAWDMTWRNAEEMDLPDEMSIFQTLTSDAGPFGTDQGLSGVEMVLAALGGLAGLWLGLRASRWFHAGHPV